MMENKKEIKGYGLRSTMYQGKVNKPVPFEKDLFALVKNVNFRKVKKKIPDKVSAIIKMIRRYDKTMIFAEKTKDMYSLIKEQHNMFLFNMLITLFLTQKVTMIKSTFFNYKIRI